VKAEKISLAAGQTAQTGYAKLFGAARGAEYIPGKLADREWVKAAGKGRKKKQSAWGEVKTRVPKGSGERAQVAKCVC